MTGVRRALGTWGERTAEAYLRVSGITVIERNWRCREGEIDLIALDGEILVFCEVKTRRTGAFGTGFEAVLGRKAHQLRYLALIWLEEHRGERRPIRFDVISVTPVRRGAPRIDHMRGAF
jgi:putative endonuclease